MKRAGGEHPADGRPHKVSKYTKYGPHVFKVLCPELLVNRLMGARGQLIHETETRTNTHMQFSRRGDYFPGSQLRILSIFARDPNGILMAVQEVVKNIADCAAEDRQPSERGVFSNFLDYQGRLVFRCVVSKAAAGGIIGTKGERIRYLREHIGAYIDVNRDIVDNHQLIVVAGGEDQVLDVMEELNKIVQADVESPWFQDWAEQQEIQDNGSVPAVQAHPPRERGGDYRERGGDYRERGGDYRGSGPDRSRHAPAPMALEPLSAPPSVPPAKRGSKDRSIFVGRLAQNMNANSLRAYFSRYGRIADADVRMDISTGRSKGFGFVTFDKPSEAEECLAVGEHHIDGQWVDVKPYGAEQQHEPEPPPRGGYDRREPAPPQRHGRWEGDHQHPQMNGQGHGREDLGRLGAGRHQKAEEDSRLQHRQRQHEVISLDQFADMAEGVPHAVVDLPYVVQFYLPSDICGPLIGNKGEKVKSIERESGAEVKFQKEEEKSSDGTGMRAVSIQGTLFCVYAAHMLLMQQRRVAVGPADSNRGGGGGRLPPGRGDRHR